MSADILQDKSVALNGKNDVPVVSQPITRGGLRVYKIVILGDGGVGKSGIIQFNFIIVQSETYIAYARIS